MLSYPGGGGGVGTLGYPLPPCEQTENITFPHPSDAIGKNRIAHEKVKVKVAVKVRSDQNTFNLAAFVLIENLSCVYNSLVAPMS